jgi:hypothetical protein
LHDPFHFDEPMSDKKPKRRHKNDVAADDQCVYRICVHGLLDAAWSDYLSGFSITHHPDDTSVLVGVVRDQAELFGLLLKIRDLGVPLLAVKQLHHRSDRPWLCQHR